MAEDDDKTPRHHRPKSHWGDDERAAVGRERRNAPPRGVPIRDQVAELDEAAPLEPPPNDDVTGPMDMHELGPVTPREAELWDAYMRFRAEYKRNKRDTGDRLLEAVGNKPLALEVARLGARLKLLMAILAAVGSLALGSAITIAKGVYARGETDGSHEARLEQVERSTSHNADRIDQLEGLLSSGVEGHRPFRLLSPPPVPLQPKEASP